MPNDQYVVDPNEGMEGGSSLYSSTDGGLYEDSLKPVVPAENVFKLNEVERESELWKKIEKYLIEVIEQRRIENELLGLSEFDTCTIRSKIAAYKEIIDIGQPLKFDESDQQSLGY